MADDETQHSPTWRAFGVSGRPRAWMRRLAGTRRPRAAIVAHDGRADPPFGVHETLRALVKLIDGVDLPNGVVELLIEDFEAPSSQLYDIHDGGVKLIEPGRCVPWASVAGPPTAWTLALGRERDTAQLRLTGDERLAGCVLAALVRASDTQAGRVQQQI
ncbi:MAG TPA: hypothetical protein VNU24_04430 [Solirubrobacteraceae bacterium]|nr:hypothetical protein [Solirubrobacteraceae bacterium]